MLSFISLVLSLSYLPLIITIYQQAHYHIKEYINYFIRHFYLELLILMVYLIYFISGYISLIMAFLILVYLLYLYSKLRIKLKFTKRIIRLFIILIPFLYINSYLCISYLFIFILCIPFFISNLIERKISHYYLKKAILKRKEFNHDVIGITGSFAKTTTKYFMSQILDDITPLATKASYNTLNGISLELNNHNLKYYNALILEMGSNHINDIKKLTSAFFPNIAVVTGIGPMHLDSLKNISNIIKEKMSIIDGLGEKGIAILNYDNEYLRNYSYNGTSYLISYGKNADFSYQILEDYVNIYAYNEFVFKFKNNGYDEIDISNMMPGIILGVLYKIDYNQLIFRLENIKRPASRQRILEIGNSIIIDDSFNSNLKGALKALEQLKHYNKKKIIITTGFVECKKLLPNLYLKYAKRINEICDYAYIVKLSTSKILYDLIEINHSYVRSVDEARLMLSFNNEAVLIENDVPDIYL